MSYIDREPILAEENDIVAYSIPFQRIPETHINVCLCKEPEKKHFAHGHWTCQKCGLYGGCSVTPNGL